jgi:ligand-binding sensor domain-containing protein
MMPYKQILWIILLLVIVPFIGRGQKIRLYNSEEGLPNSLINKVYQDNRGYIWIATENGASYFDGMRFTTFRHDRNKPGTITSDLVKVIYTDSKGVCWVGTSTGLQVFDYKSNVFREVELVDPYIDSRFYVSSIIENHNKDRLFISIAGRGIIALDINTHEIDTVTSEMFRTNFDIGYIGNLFLDSHNILWSFAEQGNFFRFDLNEKSLERDLWGDLDFDADNQPIVSSIIEDPLTGNLLIGTYKHGLFFYDRQHNIIRKTKGNSTSRYRIRSLLAEGRRGSSSEINIWIGTDDYGLKKYDRNTENIIDADFQLSPIDLNNCKVHSLIQDSQGNIWAGVYQKGLLIIPRSTYGFEYLKLSDNQSTLSPNMASATSIVRDHSGNLWIGTDGGGLFCFSGRNGVVRYSNKNTPLPNNSIMSLTIDNNGTLWVSTYMGGITTYHPQTGFQPFSNDIELQKVFCSYFDQKRNRLYFGTLGHGVMALNLSDRKITRFPNANISGWLNSLCVDSKDQIWFGRTDGIRCYNLSTGEEIRSEINNLLEGSRIYSIHEGRDGMLWFGSAEGLIRYDQEKEETQLLTKNDGLSSNLVFSIKEDKNGYIWVSTGNGFRGTIKKPGNFKFSFLRWSSGQ